MNRSVIIGAGGAAVVAVIAGLTLPGLLSGNALEDLKTRTLAGLIYVEGGSFTNGTYTVTWERGDGTKTDLPVREASLSQPAKDITLPGFYMQAAEADNADFDLFLKAAGRPEQVKIPDFKVGSHGFAAEMTWAEARDYCAWLGTVTGLTMRLPSEDEWEFAARARGAMPPYATDNGQYLEGVNTYDTVVGNNPARIGQFQPSPMGFYNMADGLYEWTAGDTGNTRIAKGGSNISTAALETIPSRYVVEGRAKSSDGVQLSRNLARYEALAEDVVYLAPATARCVAQDVQPPSQSGFGSAPDLSAIAFPSVYKLPF